MGLTALVFPGQGSQKVGMGRAWADVSSQAAAAFAEVDEALGKSLSQLIWEGPSDDLQLTANTQPAILVTSIAIYRAVQDRVTAPVQVAGHSLGEYSALVAAGTLNLADAARLVRRRGELMQEAVPAGEGAMAAILGLDAEAVGDIAEMVSTPETDGLPAEICAVANLNAPGQIVIAGSKTAVERAATLAKERGAKRAMLLPVSAPFHSPLMKPAREALEPLLHDTGFGDPSVPVVCNVDAAPVTTGDAARDALVRQVDTPVRWIESVEYMVTEGVDTFIEVGPGAVLSGLIKRIAPGTTTVSLAEPEKLDKFLEDVEEVSE